MSFSVDVSGNVTNITSATTTTVRIGAGRILGFFVASGTTPSVQISDGATSILSTAVLTAGWYPFPANFGTSLVVVTAGTTPNVSIVWLAMG
jgi:hypothetical protein